VTMDVLLATFSVTQLVLTLGAALIAFNLRKTFEGGIFERAWRVIEIAPIVYALAQVVELVEATYVETPVTASLASVVEVVFLVILVSGFFMFASAWGGSKRQDRGNGPPGTGAEGYAKTAKGAMIFILGKNGARKVIFYTGEPQIEDFESKLHGVLGNGAETVIRHMAEERADRREKGT
jgi:hypothetical protein